MAERQEQKFLKNLYWKNDHLEFIDQTKLPEKLEIVKVKDLDTLIDAIKTLKIRGAPLIGVAVGYALALYARNLEKVGIRGAILKEKLKDASDRLLRTRPTGINLQNVLSRMLKTVESTGDNFFEALINEAIQIEKEEEDKSRHIAENGLRVVPEDAKILTICNTGALAAPGFGTAFAVIRKSYLAGKVEEVYALETRPLLQGARLTMWEMKNHGIPAVLVTDSMAAPLMKQGKINFVITGADRIAMNGDTANKIGTLNLALLAYHFKIPFFIAAPLSSFDLRARSGTDIPIEERDPEEVTSINGIRVAPRDVRALNYAFDVTPASFISGIITERGVLYPPLKDSISKIFSLEKFTIGGQNEENSDRTVTPDF